MAAGLRLPPRTAGLTRFAVGLTLAAVVAFGFRCERVGGPFPPVIEPAPSIVAAEAEQGPDGTWRFEVTVSSTYDSPERYADAWRVADRDGTVYGIRELAHHHANEQPFARSLAGVELPAHVELVVLEVRDSEFGWAPTSFELDLP